MHSMKVERAVKRGGREGTTEGNRIYVIKGKRILLMGMKGMSKAEGVMGVADKNKV